MKLSEFLETYRYSVLWKKFKGGSYNQIYISKQIVSIDNHNHYWVRKQPICFDDEEYPLNTVHRALRKYLELNPGKIAFKDGNRAWFLPFFGVSPQHPVEHSSDLETAIAVFDIYQRTGNIVADASIPGNFVFYNDETICVDVDLANRRGSIASDDAFNRVISTNQFDTFFADLRKVKDTLQRPVTSSYIKILFYLDECLAQFSGSHQLIHIDMLPIFFNFCVQQVQITECVFHNLQVLISDERYMKIPELWVQPNLFCQAKKAGNYQQLVIELEANYKAFEALMLKPVRVELQVADVLDEMIDKIEKEMTFEYSFFANLPKRPIEYATKSQACLSAIKNPAR